MYCVNCGVKLADGAKACPLCKTTVYHPDIKREEAQRLYPENKYPSMRMTPLGQLMVVTALFLLPMIITFLVDYNVTGSVSWSGFVIGAVLLCYAVFVLPYWFRKPNPVIFVPVSFAVAIAYLLYIDLSISSNWFLTFAFPVAGFFMLVTSAVVTLTHYLKKGYLYIFGGAFTLIGAFMPVMELLMDITFKIKAVYWSVYPLCCFVLLGGMLLFLAICKPARESMERKFFI